MFRGKCGFCHRQGHNVRCCGHPEKQEVIAILENVIDTLNTKKDIKRFIHSLSPIRLDILACQINTASGIPTPLVRNELTRYYCNRMRIRNERHARAEYDWTDNLEERSSLWSSPHSLFCTCVNFFRSLFGTDTPRQYAELAPAEGAMFRRPWLILPDLSRDEFIEPVECPICFNSATENKITLQCSHEICNTCFINYIENGSILRAPPCPVCRKSISCVTVYTGEMYNKVASM